MMEDDQKILNQIIASRQTLAIMSLKNTAKYSDLSHRQRQTEELVEKLYSRHFSKEELTRIHNHYTGELERRCLENDAIYIQGLWDCAKALSFLGLLCGTKPSA